MSIAHSPAAGIERQMILLLHLQEAHVGSSSPTPPNEGPALAERMHWPACYAANKMPLLLAMPCGSCRQDLDRNFELSELYKGDLSSVVFAKCRANGECVIIKSFPKHQLLARPDLQARSTSGCQGRAGRWVGGAQAQAARAC
jgi:hypothetical protein